MNVQTLFVFTLLFASMVLFVTERLSMDLVAILVVLALMLTGLLTPAEALAGFSDPVVLMIAGLFVVGGALFRTGVADAIGDLLTRIAGSSETSLVVVTMATVALLSAFLSSAGATAVLIPVVVNMAWRAKVEPSKVLMPLAIGSLFGGLLTLIGTPPNLVINNELTRHGLPGFGFFSFTPIGLVVLAVAIGFIVLLGRYFLPTRGQRNAEQNYEERSSVLSLDELADEYDLPGKLFLARVRSSSPLVNRTLEEAGLRRRYGVNVLEIQRWPGREGTPQPARSVSPETHLEPNDLLHIQGATEEVTRMAKEVRLGLLPYEAGDDPLLSNELGLVEILLPPRSQLNGQTLQEARFRDKYDVTVLSMRRFGEPIPTEEISTTRLHFGDTLLVLGSWERIRLLQEERRNFVVVGLPRELLEISRTTEHAIRASLIMVIMLALMTFNVVPPVAAVMLAATAMILTNSLSMEQAYGTMNWQSIILLAGMLPLATALQKTGGVTFIAQALTQNLGGLGAPAVMAGIFVLTSVFSQFISNTATAVLMAPIAYQAATTLGVAPHAFLIAVTVAASSAFATPVATMSGTMVMAPGGYRFGDYVKMGLALQLLVLVVAMVALPILFPF